MRRKKTRFISVFIVFLAFRNILFLLEMCNKEIDTQRWALFVQLKMSFRFRNRFLIKFLSMLLLSYGEQIVTWKVTTSDCGIIMCYISFNLLIPIYVTTISPGSTHAHYLPDIWSRFGFSSSIHK